MSVPIPLAVRIATSRVDVHVTRWLRDLTFREVAKGGFASATFSIDRPLGLQPDDLRYFARIYVYDNTGTTVWEGRLEDLGIENSSEGQVWRVSAIGPSAHASDRTVPLIYVDRDVSHWAKSYGASGEMRNTTVTAGEDPGGSGSEALVLAFPPGLAVTTSSAATGVYWLLEQLSDGDIDLELAVMDYSWDCGVTSALWEIRALSSGTNEIRAQTASTGGSGNSAKVVGTDWTLGDARPFVQFHWTGGASTIGDSDAVWASIKDLTIRTITYNASGTKKSSGYTSADKTILASTVVNDLLGRLLDQYDGTNASVETTSYAITQLAYPEGTTPREVLDDLMDLEPAYRWGAYESNSAGKYRFEWKSWPTTIRYEADVTDGFSAPSSATEVYNVARVWYTDGIGRLTTVERTASVPDLDDAGLTREAKIDLPQSNTATDANQAGDSYLAEHAEPPGQGTLTVARPVLDLVDGKWVQPWQIKAGELIRIRGVQPRVAALTATGRDGVSVFKIESVEYRASDAAATLELDEYSLTTARALAATKPRRQAKRRRNWGK